MAGVLAAAPASRGASAPSQPGLQALSEAIGSSKTLAVPAGRYVLANGGLVQTRAHSWALEPGALLRGDYEAGNVDNLLTVRVTDGGAEAELRGASITGGGYLVWNPAYVAGRSSAADQFARGGYAIEIDASGPAANVVNYRISQASLAGGKGALHWVGADAGHTVAWSGAEKSTLMNGVACSLTADGMMFRDNICDGVETAYRFDLIEGAFCCTIDGGSTGNRRGALDVVNGALWRVTNCQMEHGATFAGAQASEFTVRVQGNRYRSYLGIIARSNFGAGIGRVRDTIVLQNACGTVIDENYFFLSDRCDLRLDSGASNTVFGSRNMGRGMRPIRAAGQYTDTSRRLVIAMPADAAGRRAVGTRGVWHPAADVLTGFQGGWTPRDLEILLTESGLVAFNGGLAGGARAGRICTFPAWLRPHQDAWLHATVIADGSVRALKLDAVSGDLAIVGALPGGPLSLSNAAYAAVLNAPYTIGP